MAQQVKSPSGIHEDAGSIPGLAQTKQTKQNHGGTDKEFIGEG